MPIKSSAFGRIELSGEEAAWFIQWMNEPKKPNEKLKSALEKGKLILESMKNTTPTLKS